MEEITAKDFNAKIATGKAIVDFYGVGCGNCRMLEPILLALEKEYPDINFYKVNIDTAPTLVQRFNITALPTILLVKNGNIIQPFVGLKPRNFLVRVIEDLLN